MRVITELSRASTSSRAVRAGFAVSLAAGAFAAACSQTPPTPTMPSVSPTGAATAAPAAASSAQGTNQGWQDFQARGWNCRTPNNGPVTVCSPPNQPLPTIAIPPAQPPADRPNTVLLKRWRDGVFEANVHLVRPENYNGQPCESTGQPYTYIAILGYFECSRIVGS
jgi:hypothetical protein